MKVLHKKCLHENDKAAKIHTIVFFVEDDINLITNYLFHSKMEKFYADDHHDYIDIQVIDTDSTKRHSCIATKLAYSNIMEKITQMSNLTEGKLVVILSLIDYHYYPSVSKAFEIGMKSVDYLNFRQGSAINTPDFNDLHTYIPSYTFADVQEFKQDYKYTVEDCLYR